MNQFAAVVEGYIDILLRDASLRLGLSFMKTKPGEWSQLISGADNEKNTCS